MCPVTTTLAGPDVELLAWYDALGEDPPGHRLEILEGVLLVSPSPGGSHQDRARGIANVLDEALQGSDLIAREDFDWQLSHPVTGLGSRLRPDASALDPDDPHAPRPVTVEVLSASDHERLVAGQPETRIEGKRRAYLYGGAQVHIEVEARQETVEVRWYRRGVERLELAGTARGSEPLGIEEPFPFTVVPDQLADWLRQRLGQLHGELDAERERAEAERERAEAERERADRAERTLRDQEPPRWGPSGAQRSVGPGGTA